MKIPVGLRVPAVASWLALAGTTQMACFVASDDEDSIKIDNTLAASCPPHGTGKSLVQRNACGGLSYTPYANVGQTSAVNTVPDFSFAGYKGGGVALPAAKDVRVVDPGPGDASARIQAAIKAVSDLDLDRTTQLRGAVVLRRGFYRLDNPIVIETSGVVLRGEGQGPDGTVLIATKREKHTLVQVTGPEPGLAIDELQSFVHTSILDAYVPVGTKTFHVADGSRLVPGQDVFVTRTPNDDWIRAIGMDDLTTRPGSTAADSNWSASGMVTRHERKIAKVTRINSRDYEVTVDVPLVDSIKRTWGGGALQVPNLPDSRIFNVGVENLRLMSEYDGTPDDEDHASTAIGLERVVNGWVRDITSQYFVNTAVSVSDSSYVTVQDSACVAPISKILGGRRYPFSSAGGGVGHLYQRLYSDHGRHSFVTSSRVGGPHVWVDSYAANGEADDGPHHRWATGLLFDNIHDRALAVQDRGIMGSGQGWSGAQVMFWNTESSKVWVSKAAPGSMNWAIGAKGTRGPGVYPESGSEGISEPMSNWIHPRSLYFAQLVDRRGMRALENVATKEQRNGLQFALSRYQAEDKPPADADPVCASGHSKDGLCCPKSCGSCGGEGCSSRGPNGQCCLSTITEANVSCLVGKPPCVLPDRVAPRAFATVNADPTCGHGRIGSGKVCYPLDCPVFGGSGCGSGGNGARCCGGAILAAAVSCETSEAPCVIPVDLRP